MSNPFKRIPLSRVNDPRLRIVMTMLRLENPVRPAEIASTSGLSPQLVDYHIRGLVTAGVVIMIPDEDTGTRYYVLQETFYDRTFMEGMAQALLPVAQAVGMSLEVSDEHDPVSVMKETVRYMVNVFLCTVGRDA